MGLFNLFTKAKHRPVEPPLDGIDVHLRELPGAVHLIDGFPRTLVHELAHHMVADRPLPRCLNEGLAQFMEDMVPGYRPPIIDHRQARLQRRYWSWHGMHHFWDGRAFSLKSSQRLSYQLAQILFRNLASHRLRSTRLQEFLATAHRDDAGAAACRRCFGCPLSALVGECLGPGDWEPITVPCLLS